jgi:hypothetical protein
MKCIVVLILALLACCEDVTLADHDLERGPKNVSTAALYSFVGTVVPSATGIVMMSANSGPSRNILYFSGLSIAASGLLFGPGAGHAYAGRWGRFFGWAGLRLIATGVGVFSIGLSFNGSESACTAMFAGGGILYFATVIYDFGTLGRSVRRYNAEHGLASLKIRPAYFRDSDTAGMAVSISF